MVSSIGLAASAFASSDRIALLDALVVYVAPVLASSPFTVAKVAGLPSRVLILLSAVSLKPELYDFISADVIFMLANFPSFTSKLTLTLYPVQLLTGSSALTGADVYDLSAATSSPVIAYAP